MRFTKRLSNAGGNTRKPVQRSRQVPPPQKKEEQKERQQKKEQEITYTNPIFKRRPSQAVIDNSNNIKFQVEYESESDGTDSSSISSNSEQSNSLCNKLLSIELPRVHSAEDQTDVSGCDASNSWGVLHNFDDVKKYFKDDTNKIVSYLGLNISPSGSPKSRRRTKQRDEITITDISGVSDVDKALLYDARNALTHLDEKSMVFWSIRHLSHFFNSPEITQHSVIAIDYVLRTLKPRVWNLWRENKNNVEIFNKVEELYQTVKRMELDLTIGLVKDDVSYVKKCVEKGYITSETSPSRIILKPVLESGDELDLQVYGNSDLHTACKHNSKKVVAYLTELDKRLKEHKNIEGYIALTYAAERCQTKHEKIVNKHYFSRDNTKEIDDIKRILD